MKRTALIAVVVMGLVFGLVAYAGAATSGTVNVEAKVKAQMEISVPSAVQDMGDIDPYATKSVTYNVTGKSNKAAFLKADVTNDSFTTLTNLVPATVTAWGKGGSLTKSDTVTGGVDWDVDADTIVKGSVLYTISQ